MDTLLFYGRILPSMDILFSSTIVLFQAGVQRMFLYVLPCAEWYTS